MTNIFALDAELSKISDFFIKLPLSQMRLMADTRVLWVMLIPEEPAISEWHEPSADQMASHDEEIRVVSKALELADSAEVINVGMFGHGRVHHSGLLVRITEAKVYLNQKLARDLCHLQPFFDSGECVMLRVRQPHSMQPR